MTVTVFEECWFRVHPQHGGRDSLIINHDGEQRGYKDCHCIRGMAAPALPTRLVDPLATWLQGAWHEWQR